MFSHSMTKHVKQQNYDIPKYKLSLNHLLEARSKLKPTVDYVVQSAMELLNINANNLRNQNIPITLNQYKDILAAENILEKYQYVFPSTDCTLPNTNVIINNVTVDPKTGKDKSVVISEAAVLELLELYEQMGVTIQKLVEATNKKSSKSRLSIIPKSQDGIKSKILTEELSDTNDQVFKSISSILAHSEDTVEHKSVRDEEFDNAQSASEMRTALSQLLSNTNVGDEKQSKTQQSKYEDPQDPEVKSTLSALLETSSRHLQKESTKEIAAEDLEDKPCVFIKIKCVSELSDRESDVNVDSRRDITCAKDCSSRYHLKLDGNPLTLKVNQSNVAEGTVYCINTDEESDSNEIKIIIKQCPDCRSTVVGSTTGIVDDVGESHESITLHGKQGDENKMSYSDESVKGKPKIDVVIDSDSVDKSEVTMKVIEKRRKTIQEEKVVEEEEEEEEEEERDYISLTRKRICSSMEFDVSTVHSRLRDEPIEHKNVDIVLELKDLGVDKILRACRPAKCCRKAILNEKQRTALPYCVSLKSLPLMKNDFQVIKQSIDMSEKKLKTAVDLTQFEKDTLAYYVNLGRNDFKPNSNLQWVVPVYDMKLKLNENNEIYTNPGLIQYKLFKLSDDVEDDVKKCFLLMKQGKNQTQNLKKSKYCQKDDIRFKLPCSIDKILSPKRFKLTRRKNVWNDLKYNSYGKNFKHFETNHYKEFRQFDCGHVAKFSTFSQKVTNLTNFMLPATKGSLTLYEKSSLVKKFDGGDFSIPSLTALIDKYVNQRKRNKHTSKKFTKRQFTEAKKITQIRSMPVFRTTLVEDIKHKSRSLTIFIRQTQSLEFLKIRNNVNSAEMTQLAVKWPYFSSNILHPNLREKNISAKTTPKQSVKTVVNKHKEKGTYGKRTVRCYQVVEHSTPFSTYGYNKKKKRTKNLEYYVTLMNGELVWGNSLPLKPPQYNTFYNHSNKVTENKAPSTTKSANCHQARHEESTRKSGIIIHNRKIVSNVQNKDKQSSSKKDVLPSSQNKDNYTTSSQQPKSNNQANKTENAVTPQMMMVSSFSQLGPESTKVSWAPCIVSYTSLPKVQEKNLDEKGFSTTEALPKKTQIQAGPASKIKDSRSVSAKRGYTQEDNKRKVNSQEVYARTGYVLEAVGQNVRKMQTPEHVQEEYVSRTCERNAHKREETRRSKPGDIKIAIEKLKDGTSVKEDLKQSRTKEICEIYKNHNMKSEKSINIIKEKKKRRDQTFAVGADENVNIYIQDQKVSLNTKRKS